MALLYGMAYSESGRTWAQPIVRGERVPQRKPPTYALTHSSNLSELKFAIDSLLVARSVNFLSFLKNVKSSEKSKNDCFFFGNKKRLVIVVQQTTSFLFSSVPSPLLRCNYLRFHCVYKARRFEFNINNELGESIHQLLVWQKARFFSFFRPFLTSNESPSFHVSSPHPSLIHTHSSELDLYFQKLQIPFQSQNLLLFDFIFLFFFDQNV